MSHLVRRQHRLDPAELPAAGMSTGLQMRVKYHTLSHYEPIDPPGWPGNPQMKALTNSVYPAPEYVPNSLFTDDIAGARPRSRPGMGMANMAPNGMEPFRKSMRITDPNMSNHLLPQHNPQIWLPPEWRPGPEERDMKKAGLSVADIDKCRPAKGMPPRKVCNYMDWREVTGEGRYKQRGGRREISSLYTDDIQGAKPMSFIGARPKPQLEAIEGARPRPAPGYSFGRWPPPSVVHSSFPRVGRDGPQSVVVATMPKSTTVRLGRGFHDVPVPYTGSNPLRGEPI